MSAFVLAIWAGVSAPNDMIHTYIKVKERSLKDQVQEQMKHRLMNQELGLVSVFAGLESFENYFIRRHLEGKLHEIYDEGLQAHQRRAHIYKTKMQAFAMKGQFIWPLEETKFGVVSRPHTPAQGIYVQVQKSDRVRSMWDGVIVFADSMHGFGQTVIVDHGAGVHSVYAHLSQLLLPKGARAERGQVIGYAGESANPKDSPLYFEIRLDGITQDPSDWINRKELSLSCCLHNSRMPSSG